MGCLPAMADPVLAIRLQPPATQLQQKLQAWLGSIPDWMLADRAGPTLPLLLQPLTNAGRMELMRTGQRHEAIPWLEIVQADAAALAGSFRLSCCSSLPCRAA